jgi:acyl-CoA synthetase (NDP forming)
MEQVSAKGQEIIVGALNDAQLGTLVGCGMGGVYTEIFNDAAFNLSPLTPEDIDDILDRLKITDILEGARGGTVLDISSLKECLARISQLVTQYPSISELDINPLLVLPKSKKSIVLDARIRVS